MVSIDNPIADIVAVKHRGAVLDDAHIGDINGAMGTILHGDIAPRVGWRARLKTLLAILGPGLIVMVGDNDAGAFGTYTQAGQNYGTTLMWTLMLLIPVLYVNQEMVVRLGAVTGVGHARLILERFGRFWGAFSVIDLFLLNALTIVTEFIGVTGSQLSWILKILGRLGVRPYCDDRGQHWRLPPFRAVRCVSHLREPAAGASDRHGPSANRRDGP
jgi:hypothetical protein